jgi:hypothetical protein
MGAELILVVAAVYLFVKPRDKQIETISPSDPGTADGAPTTEPYPPLVRDDPPAEPRTVVPEVLDVVQIVDDAIDRGQRVVDTLKWIHKRLPKSAQRIANELPAAFMAIPGVLPAVITAGVLAYAAVYSIAQILNFPAFNLGGGISPVRNTVDTIHFGPEVLLPLIEARMLSEGYDYDQHVQLSMVQTVGGDEVFVLAAGQEIHLLLSERGEGLSRYLHEVEPASDLREEAEIEALMRERYEGV